MKETIIPMKIRLLALLMIVYDLLICSYGYEYSWLTASGDGLARLVERLAPLISLH